MTPTPTRWLTGNTARIVSALLVCLAAPELAAREQQPQRVVWADQRLTIVAENAALDALLREVAVKTRSRVVGLEHATERVTVDIRNARLLDAMRQLLGSAHVNYLYIPRASASPVVDRVVLWLYGASAPRAGEMREAVVVDARDTGAGELAALGGYAPQAAETEVARLHREGAFDLRATPASLMGLAKSPDPEVRVLALQSLALQPSAATAEMIASALRDENIFVRGEAMVLLASMGQGKEAVSTLGAFVEHDDPEVRGVAAMALGEQGGDEAELLLRRALNDGDGAVRGFAAQSLRQRAASEKPKR